MNVRALGEDGEFPDIFSNGANSERVFANTNVLSQSHRDIFGSKDTSFCSSRGAKSQKSSPRMSCGERMRTSSQRRVDSEMTQYTAQNLYIEDLQQRVDHIREKSMHTVRAAEKVIDREADILGSS